MNKAQFENIPLATDDSLKVVRFLAADILQSKFSRAVLWILLFILGAVALISTYFVLFLLNRKEFAGMAPTYFQNFFAMLTISTCLFKGKVLNNFMARLEPWTMNNLDKIVQLSIKRKVMCIKVYVILLFFFGMISGFLIIPILPNDRNLYLAVRFFDEYFTNYSIILNYLYKMTFPCVMYTALVHTCVTIYITQHAYFQIIIFKQYLMNINEIDNSDNLPYQEEVRKRLVFFIKRGKHSVELMTSTVNEIKSIIVAFSICGGIVGISAVVCFASGYVTPDYYPRMMIFSTVAAAAFCGTIWAGQSIESELEEISKTLMKLNWYYFEKYNKKLYLIFLMNMMKVRKIQFSENYSINYELGLAIVKGIYTMASVLISMMHSEK